MKTSQEIIAELREEIAALKLYPGQAAVDLGIAQKRIVELGRELAQARRDLEGIPKDLVKARDRIRRQNQQVNDLRLELKHLKASNRELSKVVVGIRRVLCADCGI